MNPAFLYYNLLLFPALIISFYRALPSPVESLFGSYAAYSAADGFVKNFRTAAVSVIVNCILSSYALGRYTYIPSTVMEFINRHIAAITENDLNAMIRDIEDKMQYNYNKELPYKELWLELRDNLVVELKKREESKQKGSGNNGNHHN